MKTVDALRGTLTTEGGVPLRVAAYMRISDAIRRGALPAASLLPSESDLVEMMGVSRTVIREALIFLEEDGFIVSRRGIGRFVAGTLPPRGIERIQPAEAVLADKRGPADLKRTAARILGRTALFAADALALGEDDSSWIFESVLSRNDQPVAVLQEHLPASDKLTTDIAALLESQPPDQSVLRSLLDHGIRPLNGSTQLTVGAAGQTRGNLLGVSSGEPMLILTTRLLRGEVALYVSKLILNPRESHVTVNHTSK